MLHRHDEAEIAEHRHINLISKDRVTNGIFLKSPARVAFVLSSLIRLVIESWRIVNVKY